MFHFSLKKRPLLLVSLLFLVMGFIFFASSCKKKTQYVYGVDDATVSPDGSNKPNVKTTTEFISIAYSDLFGKTISTTDLNKIATAYESFGDQKLIEELIIKNFLNSSGTNIVSKADMKKDVNGFVSQAYKKFYGREASAFELWNIANTINSDTTLTPELIYFGMMTSNEYRYY